MARRSGGCWSERSPPRATAWHGFLRTPSDWPPVIRAVWLCALYISLPLIGAYLIFLRRDVACE